LHNAGGKAPTQTIKISYGLPAAKVGISME
jgi:hypothetical protein